MTLLLVTRWDPTSARRIRSYEDATWSTIERRRVSPAEGFELNTTQSVRRCWTCVLWWVSLRSQAAGPPPLQLHANHVGHYRLSRGNQRDGIGED